MPYDLTFGQTVIILLRLAVPLLILRWSLLGGALAMLLDGTDVIIVEFFSSGGMGPRYHVLDKYLDLYYLSLEAYVSLKWKNTLARSTSIGLFVYRFAGVILFEVTGLRKILFFFPNMFENWFLFYMLRTRFFPGLRLDTWRRVGLALALLYVPKFGQEYLLHYQEAQPWDWFKDNVLS